MFHTGSAERVLALVRTGLLRVDFEAAVHQARLETLAKRYADRSPDLADLCLICLSERFPTLSVLTVNRDFEVYRRLQREVIPVIMPSKGS